MNKNARNTKFVITRLGKAIFEGSLKECERQLNIRSYNGLLDVFTIIEPKKAVPSES